MKQVSRGIWWSSAFLWLLCPLALIAQPQRIVSLAPNITEMVFRLGQGERLVGRTEYCLYPPAASKVQVVGGYLDLDYEALVALQPDLVLLLPNTDREKKLHELGLRTFTIPNETIDDNFNGLRALGQLLGCQEAAAHVRSGIEDTLRAVREWAAERDQRVSALLVIGRQAGSLKGIYAAAGDTYLSELWELCGGVNSFSEAPARYFEVSKEALIAADPDVILEFRIISPEKAGGRVPALIADWQALPVLKAVQNKSIFIFTDRYFIIPGPRLAKIAVAFQHILQGMAQP